MKGFGFASFTAGESQAGSLCRARCKCRCNAVEGPRQPQPTPAWEGI